MIIKLMQVDRPLWAFNRRILPQILATFMSTIGCRIPGAGDELSLGPHQE